MTHDYFTEVMQRTERAEENLYFARLDRKLIDQLHQQKELLQQGATSFRQEPLVTNGASYYRLNSAMDSGTKPSVSHGKPYH